MILRTSTNFRCTALAIGLACQAVSASAASIGTTERVSDMYVSFSGLDFANATVNLTSTFTIADASSGSEQLTLGPPSANLGLQFFSTGSVSVSPTTFPAGTTVVPITLSVSGPGTWGYNIAVPGKTGYIDPAQSWVGVYPFLNYQNLELYFPANGFLDQGGTWITNIYFPGDWSKTTNSDNVPGAHELIDLDPGYTVTSDFAYDPATNATLFSVMNTDFSIFGPNPDIVLIGAPIPEPATMPLVVAGLGLFWLLFSKFRGRTAAISGNLPIAIRVQPTTK